MRTSLPTLAALALLGTGCIVTHGHGRSVSSAAVVAPAKKCPPGHQWSDGGCHAKGKGHDPQKHQK